ncbi:MAG: lamin tail domain-containing protein [Anaerolineales bacterium]|nr:lamin tail domain-containing protein [Anaerolineales bacterium]
MRPASRFAPALYLLLALGLCFSLALMTPRVGAAPGTPSPTLALVQYSAAAVLAPPTAGAGLRRPVGAAAPGSVVINEVITDPQLDWSSTGFDGLPGGGAVSTADEAVELYIKTAGLNLSDWTIELQDDSPASGGLGAGGAFAVARFSGAGNPANTSAGAYLVLGDPTSNSLSNTILIVLKDGGGQVIDQVQLGGGGGNAPDGNATGIDDEAVVRVPNGQDSNADSADFDHQPASLGRDNDSGQPPPGVTDTPTATSTGTLPTATATGTATNTPMPGGPYPAIVLNEVLPRGAEFIELYNPTGAAVDLAGWRLDDIDGGGTSPYMLPPDTRLAAGGWLVLTPAETGVGLNDDGDTARLLRPDGTVADAVSYTNSLGAAFSLARVPDGGGWSERGLPSPGAANQAAALPDSRVNGISSFRGWPDGAWVTLRARVSVLPGVFSPRTIHLQDATGGVTVYLGRDDWPPLALGQWMEVLGYLRRRSGELQLYVRNGWHVRAGPADDLAPPAPSPATTGQIGEGSEGALVTVTGRVLRLEESALWLDDGSGPARVFFAAATGLPRPAAHAGETWRVTGVVVEFTTSSAAAPNFRLQPRAAADVARIVDGVALPYVPADVASPTPEPPDPTATPEP